MKQLLTTSLFAVLFLLSSCIGEDIIDDSIDEAVRIDNPVLNLEIGETYQFEATYFNNVGQPENATILWSSTDENIINITQDGLATGITEGVITVSAAVIQDDVNVISNNTLAVVESSEEEEEPIAIVKSGIIETTSSYTLEGAFVFEEILESNSTRLSFNDSYQASSNLPGLYLYLTNNPNSIANAYNAGPVAVFDGAHSYEFDDVQINDFQYLLYWCEPFSVKVGEGTIN
ncbi:hypothetical protein [Dokdonia sp.]|uniref:hypothetical protein n=1 Tax=Dokdonia sp. TaxID=2024995 RepID=UPI00326439A2